MPPETNVIIVGAGLSGLACAKAAAARGAKVLVLEAGARPGGRVQTEECEGFACDRGFQVMLTAYPECQRTFDYAGLKLGRFEPGAYIWTGSELALLADPFRTPSLWREALAPATGTLLDKLRLGLLKWRLGRTETSKVFAQPERSTAEYLNGLGLSPTIQDRFLRPFFGGIFLEQDLSTTSRMFEFVFKMFGSGDAALPAGGIEALARQLHTALPSTVQLRCNSRVEEVNAGSGTVRLSSGELVTASSIVVATDLPSTATLLPKIPSRPHHGTRCVYFAAPQSPLPRRMIALNGSGEGDVSLVAVPSDIAPGYAPAGQHLVSVSLQPQSTLAGPGVLEALRPWFGSQVDAFRLLHDVRVEQALPRQAPGDCAFEAPPQQLSSGVWVCGDHQHSSSVQGALWSGRAVGEALQW